MHVGRLSLDKNAIDNAIRRDAEGTLSQERARRNDNHFCAFIHTRSKVRPEAVKVWLQKSFEVDPNLTSEG